MKLFEFEKEDLETAYYDPENDEINKRHFDDTRKPKLTLRDLNKLKKLKAVKKFEALKRQDLISAMYGSAGGGDDGGGGAPF
jgi:hypothetical protein